jgi:hypothetical protein
MVDYNPMAALAQMDAFESRMDEFANGANLAARRGAALLARGRFLSIIGTIGRATLQLA